MIQRIQSVWLFLSAICMALLFKMPYYSALLGADASSTPLTVGQNLLLFIIAVVLGVLSFVTIFLYKQRGTQKQLIWLGVLGALLLLALMYFKAEDLLNAYPNNHKNESFKLGAVFPILYVVLMLMAYFAVRADDKLVKSVDRLR